jgi:hypothetical protein
VPKTTLFRQNGQNCPGARPSPGAAAWPTMFM